MSRIFIITLCATLLCSTAAWADIYTWTDASGNTVYSDKPNPNATPVEIGRTNTMSVPPPSPSPATTQTGTTGGQPRQAINGAYRTLQITSPTDDTAVRANDGNITLTVKIDPPLRSGNMLRATVDGTLSKQGVPGDNQPTASMTLVNLDRGTHSISAVITDSKGSILNTSTPVSVHVQRTSLNQPGRIGGANQAPTAP